MYYLNRNMYIYNQWNQKLAFHNIGLLEEYFQILKYSNIPAKYYHFRISLMDNLEKMQNNYNIYMVMIIFYQLSMLYRQYQDQKFLFGMYFFMLKMHRHQSNKHNIFYKFHQFLCNLDDPQNIMHQQALHLHLPIFKPKKVNK